MANYTEVHLIFRQSSCQHSVRLWFINVDELKMRPISDKSNLYLSPVDRFPKIVFLKTRYSITNSCLIPVKTYIWNLIKINFYKTYIKYSLTKYSENRTLILTAYNIIKLG